MFLSQFLQSTVPQFHISSLTDLSSIFHAKIESNSEVTCKILQSTLLDIVIGSNILCVLTKDGHLRKMNCTTGKLNHKPLLTDVKSVALLNAILAVKTYDGFLYTFDLSSKEDNECEEEFDQGSQGLSRKGDLVQLIVNESNQINVVNKTTEEWKEKLSQLKLYQIMTQANVEDWFQIDLQVLDTDIVRGQKLLVIDIANRSENMFLGDFWSIKIEISSEINKGMKCKLFSLTNKFAFNDQIKCHFPLPISMASHFPLAVKSLLLYRGNLHCGGQLPTLPIGITRITVVDILSMAPVFSVDHETEYNRKMFLKSIGCTPNDITLKNDKQETFVIDKKLMENNSKHLMFLNNASTTCFFFEKQVKICCSPMKNASDVQVDIVCADELLIERIKQVLKGKS